MKKIRKKMRCKFGKAFTLIELLAVIIILSILSIITTAVINNNIEKARKQAFKVSASGVLRAIEISVEKGSYTELPVIYVVNQDGIKKKDSVNISDVDYTGELDATGYAYVNSNEISSLCICNDKYCATKQFYEREITIRNKTNSLNCGSELILDANLNLDDINDDTVEIMGTYSIITPNIRDTEGEPLQVKYTVYNSSGNIIGDDTNMAVIDNNYTRVYNDTIMINYLVYDPTINKSNTKNQTITVIDTVNPTLSASISSRVSTYNSLDARLSINATDNSNLQMYISQSGYDTGGSWETYASVKNFDFSGSLNGSTKYIYITVRDEAGNIAQKRLNYTLYNECTNYSTDTEVGECSTTCGVGTKTTTITYNDFYTGKYCTQSTYDETCESVAGCGSSGGGSSGGGSSGGSSCSGSYPDCCHGSCGGDCTSQLCTIDPDPGPFNGWNCYCTNWATRYCC